MVKDKFYVTTPIYYASGSPHIGHAYTTIAADVLARYYRQKGDEVFFLTGTDEHGAKIQEVAEEKKETPKQFVDGVAEEFKTLFKKLDISNNNFIRTTEKEHEKSVSEALQKMYDAGYIYKGEYEALYCVECEQYKSKSDLVDGLCSDHKKKPEVHKEESYLFKLSAFQDDLLKKIKKDEYKIRPTKRKNEVVSFYEKEGLSDIAFSRKKEKVEWGIELPFDKGHTAYVWADAFLNYLTGLGWTTKTKDYKTFWPADVQLMSKDILRVHATIWPAMLLALGEELPKQLFIHGYFTVNGHKMGKSQGNTVDPTKIADEYGADVLKYFILRDIPFGNDGDFSTERLAVRYKSDLSGGLGNLMQRTLTMINKYNVKPKKLDTNVPVKQIHEYIEKLEFDKALDKIWLQIKYCDTYIENNKPWDLAKEGKDKKLEEVLSTVYHYLKNIQKQIYPFMPETSEKMKKQLETLKPKPLFPKLEK